MVKLGVLTMREIEEQTIERNNKILKFMEYGEGKINLVISHIENSQSRLHDFLSHLHGLVTAIKIFVYVILILICLFGITGLIKWIF